VTRAAGMLRMLVNSAVTIAIVYCAVTALLYLFQSRLIYFPQLGGDLSTTPRAYGLEYRDVWLAVEPGVKLHGWYVPRNEPKGAALVLHGNAGSIALRIDWLRMFHELGYAAFVVDYRGYGRSTGSPDEKGTYDDARAAFDYLVARERWQPGDIVIVGESLGGAIAAELASHTAPRALVLQSAFTSVPDLAQRLYPIFPARWISRFSYDTRGFLAHVSAPVFVAHSRSDEIIPFSHGQALFAAAHGPKFFLELRGGHNEGFIFTQRAWVEALATFLQEHAVPRSKPE
jgi:fermentation-respiration switch protein FrsA (DUF1100 family)